MFFMINTDGSTALQFITKPDNPKQAASAIFAKISWTANLSGAFAVGLVLHLFPDLAVKLGVPSDSHGTMLAIMRIVVIATYLTMHSLTFWHHRFAVNMVSQFAGLCGLLFLAFAVSQIWLIVGLCLLGFLIGFNYFASLYYSTSSSHEKKKGLAGGDT
jgi:cyanate permease